jgi:hypothetical protein
MGRVLNIVVMVLFGGMVGQGCDPDPLFMDCPLSNSIKASCATESESIVYTCVVAEHPYCLESICASWQGGPSECTLGCAGDSDCPAGSSCQSHLDLKFCVRNIHLNAHVFDLPDVVPSD